MENLNPPRAAMTWRERTESFDYRVVFLPEHSLDAKVIAGARLLPPTPGSSLHGIAGFPQRTQIDVYQLGHNGQVCAQPWSTLTDETGELFSVITEAIARAHEL